MSADILMFDVFQIMENLQSNKMPPNTSGLGREKVERSDKYFQSDKEEGAKKRNHSSLMTCRHVNFFLFSKICEMSLLQVPSKPQHESGQIFSNIIIVYVLVRHLEVKTAQFNHHAASNLAMLLPGYR